MAQGKDRGRGNKPFCRPSTGIQAALLLARWGKALRHTFMYRLCPGSSCLASAGGIVSFIAVVSRVRAPRKGYSCTRCTTVRCLLYAVRGRSSSSRIHDRSHDREMRCGYRSYRYRATAAVLSTVNLPKRAGDEKNAAGHAKMPRIVRAVVLMIERSTDGLGRGID